MATALLIGVPLVAILALGPLWMWFLAVALASGIGLREFYGLVFQDGPSARWLAFYIAAGMLLPLGAFLKGPEGLHPALVSVLFLGFLSLLVATPLDSRGVSRLAGLILGWLYIPYLLSYVLLIGQLKDGRGLLFLTFLVVVANDVGAFYCGTRYGRHRLYERVSPKKSLEGSAGGLLLSLLVGVTFGFFFAGEMSLLRLLLFSGLLAVVGQFGDLMESMLKRMSGIKDSSNLLPGHGGILDRLDSLLFGFPAAWFFLAAK